MEEKKPKEEKKLSYEELQQICGELSQRLQYAQEKLEEVNATNAIHRLNLLFKVLEQYALFPAEFVDKCSNEIMSIMNIDDAAENKDKEDDSRS